MKFFIGLVIGIVIGFFYTALMSSCGHNDAYIDGANYAKEVIINYLIKHIDCEEGTNLVENIRKMLFV